MYDPVFKGKVEEAELIVSSRAREMMLSALDESQYGSVDDAKIVSQKSYNAMKIAEKLEPKKFGSKKIEISGSVNHQHQHKLMAPEERFAMLWEDRRKFIESRRQQALNAAPKEEEEAAIDVEIVED